MPDGTQIFYGIRGSTGLPIVFNDGIGCDGFVWAYLQPELAKTNQVVHWNYRGHGRSGSPKQTSSLCISQLAQDLHEVLKHLNLPEPFGLWGHSMGTQVVLEYYRQARASVNHLVLICGTHGQLTTTFHGNNALKRLTPGLVEFVLKNRKLARGLWGRVPTGLAFRFAKVTGEVNGNKIRERDFQTYWDHINLVSPQVFFTLLNSAGEHDATDLLSTISAPTLVIAAEKDTFVPPHVARKTADGIERASLKVVQDASHALPVEQPEYVQGLVREFLTGISTRP